jgi:hypothetical protein
VLRVKVEEEVDGDELGRCVVRLFINSRRYEQQLEAQVTNELY